MRKRLLFLVTSIVMLAVMGITLSAHAFADDRTPVGGGPVSGEGLAGSKYVYVNEDGTYDVELETYASGEVSVTTKVKPTDIVLVLDNSGSMHDRINGYWTERKIVALVNAVNGFLGTVAETNEEAMKVEGTTTADLSTVAIVTYRTNSNGTSNINTVYDFTAIRSSNLNTSSVKYGTSGVSQGHELSATGATPTDLGLKRADDLLNALISKPGYSTTDRNRVVLLFTDGYPTYASDLQVAVARDAINNAGSIKKNRAATVYSVAVLNGASPATNPETGYSAWGATYSNGVTTSRVDGDNRRIATANIFLHAVSSNYPNASAALSNQNSRLATTWGTGGDYAQGYYMAATSADELSAIFQKISSASGTTVTDLGSEAVMKDIVASSFTLPDGVTPNDIHVKVVRWNSNTHAWGTGDAGTTYVRTKDQWKTDTGEEIEVTIDGKTVDITGFDYKEHTLFTTDPDKDIDGINDKAAKIVVTFTMYAEPASITGSSVETNGAGSGLYENADAEEAVITFPQPKVTFTPIPFVIDYAKPTDLDYSSVLETVTRIDNPSDNKLQGLIAISDEDYQQLSDDEKKNYFDFNEVHSTAHGYVAFHDVFKPDSDQYDPDGFRVTYIPRTMDWSDYDRIFVMGRPHEGVGDVWTYFTVMPANNVYYEDSFAGSYDYSDSYHHPGLADAEIVIGDNGIKYEGSWTNDDESEDHIEEHVHEHPQGWIDLLEDETEYTGNSVHYVSESGAKASFTFSGTGVDVYSRTNNTTGTIAVMLQGTTAGGTKVSQGKVIDNKAKSGDYYVIPTCSFNGLEYGRYTVTIIVTKAAESDGGRLTYYLDGVKIYNPIQPHENEQNVIDAYGAENLNAVFTDVRSLLLNDGDFSGERTGAIYIDEITDSDLNETTDLAVYEKEGPKSELYLSPGQGVAISVTADHNYYVGLKVIDGKETNLKINDTELTIKHTADMYYKAVPVDGKVITITNVSGGILSVTKLRSTNAHKEEDTEPDQGNSSNGVKFVSAESLLEAYRQVSEMPAVPFDLDEEEEEVVEEFNAEEIVIENPEPEVNEETVPEPVSEETEAPANNLWANLLALIGGFRAILHS